jgi:hypothetical protein
MGLRWQAKRHWLLRVRYGSGCITPIKAVSRKHGKQILYAAKLTFTKSVCSDGNGHYCQRLLLISAIIDE